MKCHVHDTTPTPAALRPVLTTMFFHAVRCVDECERLIGVEKCAERFLVSEFPPAVRALNTAGALFVSWVAVEEKCAQSTLLTLNLLRAVRARTCKVEADDTWAPVSVTDCTRT